MISTTGFALIGNGEAIPWAEVPERSAAAFVEATAEEVVRGGRLSAWFGVPAADGVHLVAVVAFDPDGVLAVGRSGPVRQTYPALTPRAPQAHLFEREILEQHGIVPEGHPWLKPVRFGSRDPGRAGAFFRVDGSEVHEVAVGPVHAGVIEPGHFRFQCDGEEILHLEIALGYQHRGVEEALMGGPHPITPYQMETLAGDTTIGHVTAYAMALESLAGADAPLRAQWLRAVALELERLANHTGDLGALAGDVAYQPTAAACGRIRGDFLNMTAAICGNRFGRGLVRPGGCGHDLDPGRVDGLLGSLRTALADVEEASEWLWNSNSVRSRFESTGIVPVETAVEIGLVGPVARASGLVRDVRFDHPAGWHRFAQMPVAVWPGGDVFARARVRWLEVRRSGAFVEEQVVAPPEGRIEPDPGPLRPNMLAASLVEGWRGEICHVAITGPAGRFRRYKVVDPSFHNWPGLALALRGQAISDFPLCNKSFNLSYCGFDL
jgi:Ni,Fe-hydrogenase III large subunit